MPNRIIRDGFVDSEAVCALSDWAHRFYSNLLVRCDDAGRFDGRLEILRSHLFPLGTDRRAEDFQRAIDELVQQSLARVYEFGGKPFIQLTKWQRAGKSERSKCPWIDGSFVIRYATIETKDGPKEFVTSSLTKNDPIAMPSAPHADGVTAKSNTETETETGCGCESRAPPDDAIQRLEMAFLSRYTGPELRAGELYGLMEDCLNAGIAFEAIQAEINRQKRPRKEFPREMVERLTKPKEKPAETPEQRRARIAEERRRDAEERQILKLERNAAQ